MPALTVVVEQCLAPVPGGTGRLTAELTKALAAQAPAGWSVQTVAAWHRDLAAAHLPPARGPRRLPVGRRALAELWARGLPPVPSGDSVHAPTPLAPPRRKRLVVAVHDTVPWSHPETLTARGAAWHRRIIARAAADADVIVAGTEAVAEELRRLFPLGDRVVVIPHGVTPLPVPADAAARRTRLGLPERYLLTLSTMEPRKGLDVAVAALARPALAGQRLAIVGQPGWGGMDPIAAAAALGVDPNRISVLGRLDDADLAAVLEHAAALLVPSRSEGFGLPMVEGMAAGIPVVHSEVPALVEVAGGAGLGAPVGDDRAWAETVAGLLADDGLAAQLRALGRRRAAEFTWSATAELTWALHAG